MNRIPQSLPTNQKGAALIVSLLILVVLTLLGINSIGGSNLEERMAQNFHHTTLAFHAAESSINTVLSISNPEASSYNASNDLLNTALLAGIGNTSTTATYNMDPGNTLPNTSLNTTTTISHIGISACPQSSMGQNANSVACGYFEINADASISATHTSTSHVQGVYRPVPSAN